MTHAMKKLHSAIRNSAGNGQTKVINMTDDEYCNTIIKKTCRHLIKCTWEDYAMTVQETSKAFRKLTNEMEP